MSYKKFEELQNKIIRLSPTASYDKIANSITTYVKEKHPVSPELNELNRRNPHMTQILMKIQETSGPDITIDEIKAEMALHVQIGDRDEQGNLICNLLSDELKKSHRTDVVYMKVPKYSRFEIIGHKPSGDSKKSVVLTIQSQKE